MARHQEREAKKRKILDRAILHTKITEKLVIAAFFEEKPIARMTVGELRRRIGWVQSSGREYAIRDALQEKA